MRSREEFSPLAFHTRACEAEAISQHLSVDVSTMQEAAGVDILSVYAAAKFAIDGFSRLPATVPRVFIVEGNVMPFAPAQERYLSLGFGRVRELPCMVVFQRSTYGSSLHKQACQAYLINYLATYRGRNTGERFYFAYQVHIPRCQLRRIHILT
jgi:hypothetical protein